ncbi:MAG: AAA family ATPase [Desulfovibrionaceae bacterium]|nr:AAA family ATPase [Desulfovibrionaceae bacterium]
MRLALRRRTYGGVAMRSKGAVERPPYPIATIKQYTDKFRLIFITGVTRASHVSIFSAFNNLLDLSLDSEFNHLLGFTKNDLNCYFHAYVENSAKILKMSKNDVYTRLEQYYDGFQFSIEANETVYNLWSILSFFKLPRNGFQNYCFKTSGINSILMKYLNIRKEFNFLNYRNRKFYVDKDELLDRYDISDIPPKILLFQSGYFTIRNARNNSAFLETANTEIEDGLLRLYFMSNNITPMADIKLKINELDKNIDERNLKAIISVFNAILNDCVSILSTIFNDKRSVRDIT